MVISTKSIRSLFAKNDTYPVHLILGDRDYFCPTVSCLVNDICPKYIEWLKLLNLDQRTPKWDCDNFADSFKFFCNVYHKEKLDQSQANGIGVGTIFYHAYRPQKANTIYHAINIIFCDHGLKEDNSPLVRPIFLEPQNGSTLTLTTEEFNSIQVVYI